MFDAGLRSTDFAYRTIGESFRMIESGLLPVIVATEPEAKATLGRLGIETIPSSALARELQGYVVQVPPKAWSLLLAAGHIQFEHEALRGDQFAVLRNTELYTDDVGLIWDRPEYLSSENTII